MNYNNMKNFLFGFIAIVLSTVTYGQTTFKGEGKYSSVESTNIKSSANSIITEVKVTDNKTGVTLPSFVYILTSQKESDIKTELKEDSKSFNGVLTIEVDGQIVYKVKVLNGNFEKPEVFEFTGTTEAGKKYPCTIKGNIQCARDTINAMNWFDYAICAMTAPECLAQTHISCAIDNC